MPRAYVANKLNELKLDTYFDIFIEKTKLKDSNSESCEKRLFKLLKGINYLVSIEKHIIDKYTSHERRMINLMEKWNESFVGLSNTINEWADKGHIITPKINYIVKKWNENFIEGRSPSIKHTITHLVNPLCELVQSKRKTDPEDPYTFRLSILLNELKIIEMQWKAAAKGDAKVFETISKNIDTTYNRVRELKNDFEKETKTKWM